MKYKEDDVVFCTVKGIEGTTIFLEVEEGFPASMVLSEVAAGRIRNLRNYVSPNRKIVCKILKVMPDHLELSLRRVTTKEREGVLERHKKERALTSMLVSIGENPDSVIEKIKREYDLSDFFDEALEDAKVIEKFMSKKNALKLFGMISVKDSEDKTVTKKIFLKSFSDEGVVEIKEVLDLEAEIHYLGASKFSIFTSGRDFKEANNHLSKVLSEIEKRAKEKKAYFEIIK